MDTAAVRECLQRITSPTRETRWQAISRLAEKKHWDNSPDISDVVQVLSNLPLSRGGEKREDGTSCVVFPDREFRKKSIEVLENIGRSRVGKALVIPGLIRTLQNDIDVWVRDKAAKALGYLGPEARGAIPSLVRRSLKVAEEGSLQGEGKWVIWAIGRLGKGEREAVKALCAVIKQRIRARIDEEDVEEWEGIDCWGDVCAIAAEALGRIGGIRKRTLSVLSHALGDVNGSLRIQAAYALWRLCVQRQRVSPACVQLGQEYQFICSPKCLLEVILRELKKEENENCLREDAARVLGRIGPAAKQAVNDLMMIASKDEASDVRQVAKDALQRIDPEAANQVPEFDPAADDHLLSSTGDLDEELANFKIHDLGGGATRIIQACPIDYPTDVRGGPFQRGPNLSGEELAELQRHLDADELEIEPVAGEDLYNAVLSQGTNRYLAELNPPPSH